MVRPKKTPVTGTDWVPLQHGLPEDDAAEYLSRVYKFDDSDDLRNCLYVVQCRVTRDLAPWLGSRSHKYKRTSARDSVIEMIKASMSVKATILHLRGLVQMFEDESEYEQPPPGGPGR
jgi:hypothetical protein